MAEISKITLPNNSEYDLKDATARGGMVWYGVCNTVADTAAKAVTINGITELTEGLSIRVKMMNSVSVASATLNLNSLGAKAITRSAKPSLPAGYTRVLGFSMNDNTYYKITGLKLAGSDTVRFSFSITATCNVFGCYSSSSATNNYSMYATTSSGGQYLRYDGSTYNSYIPSASLGTRFDVVITPHGTSGMPTDSSWTAKTFTASDDMCIGTSSDSTTSAKMKGSFYGAFIVDGKFNGIPCERDSDNVLGYYDTYSKTFYEPETGTPTSLGDDTNDYFDNVGVGEWNAGEVLDLVYDGTSWVIVDGAIADEETYGYTKLSSSTSSTSKDMAATPSAVKTAYDLAYGKQDALVSGTNIKTINNTSLLGSGNISIPEIFWATYETTSYSDISTALSAGKVCAISYYGNVGFLVSSNSEKHVFQFFDSYSCYSLECYSEGYWSLGSGYVQPVINTEGLVKAYGDGVVSAAEAGTDYQAPLTAGTDYIAPPSSPSSGNVLTYNGSAWVASAVPEELFICDSNTSYNDVVTAYEAGKILFYDKYTSDLDFEDHIYFPLYSAQFNEEYEIYGFQFSGIFNNHSYAYEIDGEVQTWGYHTTNLQTSLPTQSGQSGKYLTTNGSSMSWGAISIPSASTTTPSMDGTASYGSGTTWARADHVHPTDTSRQASITASGILKGNGSGTITAATAGTDYALPSAIPSAYTSNPAMDGSASAGSSTAWAKGDHVHPTDTSRQSKICTGSITTTTTWTGSGPYTQTVTVSGLPTGVSITSNSKVDLQPDATAIAQLVSDSVKGLYVSNSSGTLTMYAVGAAPTAALTLQVTVTEVAS